MSEAVAPTTICDMGGGFYWYPALKCMFKAKTAELALAYAQLAWWKKVLGEEGR